VSVSNARPNCGLEQIFLTHSSKDEISKSCQALGLSYEMLSSAGSARKGLKVISSPIASIKFRMKKTI
jgi:hypothetical protein